MKRTGDADISAAEIDCQASGTMNSDIKEAFEWTPLDSPDTIALQQHEALLQLHFFFGSQSLSPLMGGWAMEPISVWSLIRIVMDLRLTTILECGSGTSTVWLGRALKKAGSGRLWSLEHDDGYRAKVARLTYDSRIRRQVSLPPARLRYYDLAAGPHQWYDISHLPEGNFDLVIVDGPPGRTTRFSRYPALPLLKDRVAPGGLIAMDDVDRKNERIILRNWIQEFPGLKRVCALGPRTELLQFWP